MRRSLEELQRIQEDFTKDRPIIKDNNDAPRLFSLLRGEVDEAEVEIGNKEKLGPELADIAIFLLQIASVSGIDLEAEILEKTARNMLKYEAKDFQEGEYTQKLIEAKKTWLHQEGDKNFYAR